MVNWEAYIRNGNSLEHIQPFQNHHLCEIALRRNGLEIEHVNFSLFPQRRKQFYIIALNQTAYAITHIPADMQTRQMARIVINRRPSLFTFVRKDLIDESLWIIILQNTEYTSLAQIPKSLRNTRIFMTAVTHNGIALELITHSEQTLAICLAAFESNPKSVRYVSPSILRKGFYEHAFSKRFVCETYEGMPEDARTPKMMLQYLENGGDVNNVPPEFRSLEIYRQFASKNYSCFMRLPKEEQTKEMIMSLIHNHSDIYLHVRDDLLTDDVVISMLRHVSVTTQYLDYSILSKPVALVMLCEWSMYTNAEEAVKCYKNLPDMTYGDYLTVIKRRGYMILHTPEEFIDEDMVVAAIKSNRCRTQQLNHAWLTPHICKFLVERNEYNFFHIPKKCITTEIILLAQPRLEGWDCQSLMIACARNRMLSPEIIFNACKHLRYTIDLRYFRREYYSEYAAIMEEAVSNNAQNIIFVSPDKRTYDMKKTAVAKNPDLLRYIKKSDQTKDMLDAIFESLDANYYGIPLKYTNLELLTSDMWHILLYGRHRHLHKDIIKYLPPRFHTSEVYLHIIRNYGLSYYQYFHAELLKEDHYIEAVLQDTSSFTKVPDMYLTRSLFDALIESNPHDKYGTSTIASLVISSSTQFARLIEKVGDLVVLQNSTWVAIITVNFEVLYIYAAEDETPLHGNLSDFNDTDLFDDTQSFESEVEYSIHDPSVAEDYPIEITEVSDAPSSTFAKYLDCDTMDLSSSSSEDYTENYVEDDDSKMPDDALPALRAAAYYSSSAEVDDEDLMY